MIGVYEELLKNIDRELAKRGVTKREFISTVRQLMENEGENEIPGEKALYAKLSGRNKIEPDLIRYFARALGVTEQDLFDPSKKIQILKDILKNPTKEALELLKSQYPAISETIEVPVINHEVSAGVGLQPFETEVIDKLIIDKEKLLPQYPPERIEALKVKGNSMEPYVSNGDYVIIYRFEWDEPIEKIDDIYVINYDNQLMVKQIQFVGGSRIRIVSINPSYPPIELDMDDSQVFFAIVGRVVLRILKG